MPLTIQALPKGLVGFLELNTGGAGPPVLNDQVIATLDMLPFFALGRRETINTTAVAGGTAANDFVFNAAATPIPAVPGNEAWYVYQYHVSASIPALLTAQVMPTYQRNVAGGQIVMPLGPPVSNGSNVLASTIRAPASQPFWLVPGSVLGGTTLSLLAATAFSVFGNIEFVRFRL